GGLEGERLHQGPHVRDPRNAPHWRQGKGLRESDDHAEVNRSAARRALIAIALAAAASPACGARGKRHAAFTERYRNPDLPAAERGADLGGRMTVAGKSARTMPAAPAIPRLGVPPYEWWNEALHGVARADRATVFPQAIALAATFDDALVRNVAAVISDEA